MSLLCSPDVALLLGDPLQLVIVRIERAMNHLPPQRLVMAVTAGRGSISYS